MNLREEPIIFINGKPYSLRNVTDMINNLIITGIDSYTIVISLIVENEYLKLKTNSNRISFMRQVLINQ